MIKILRESSVAKSNSLSDREKQLLVKTVSDYLDSYDSEQDRNAAAKRYVNGGDVLVYKGCRDMIDVAHEIIDNAKQDELPEDYLWDKDSFSFRDYAKDLEKNNPFLYCDGLGCYIELTF